MPALVGRISPVDLRHKERGIDAIAVFSIAIFTSESSKESIGSEASG